VTQIVAIDPHRPDAAIIASIAEQLRAGRLVAFPTETVYGLGVDATNPDAVERLFAAKRRPHSDPLILHVKDVAAMRALATDVPPAALQLADAFWPGPLTLVLRRAPHVLDAVTAGLDTVAIRVPAHPVAHALVTAAARPIAAPSANLFSRPSPTRAEHVLADLAGVVDVLIDAGPTTVGVESTVVDVTGSSPRVLRPGGVSLEALRAVVPDVEYAIVQAVEGEHVASPGLLTRHYAPRTPLVLFEGTPAAVLASVCRAVEEAPASGAITVVLGTSEMLASLASAWPSTHPAIVTVDLGSVERLDDIAGQLYQSLRICDQAGAERILAMQVPDAQGLGLAIRDRLRRAAAGHIVTCA
jgi:L-threonylcarbamoyladenylate synthase